MSRGLYIGIQTAGTTSRMRCDTLQRILPTMAWGAIDTDTAFANASRVWRSVGFRWKFGPMVAAVNQNVCEQIEGQRFDLIWVDKAIYLFPSTVRRLRDTCETLVHFTPDTAFFGNRSRHFFRTAALYDLLVTTKSFELDQYDALVGSGRVMLVTQAYDTALHRVSDCKPVEKRRDTVFVGLCEPDRQRCVETLLDAGVPIRLGGRGWEKLLRRRGSDARLTFLGSRVFGLDYVRAIAEGSVGLGLLSKRFPELHTTRTLEIPACGTVVATERNIETTQIFSPNEALFFENYDDLACQVVSLLGAREELGKLEHAGWKRVTTGGYSYDCVLASVLDRAGFGQSL
ncbi:hypothetical protein Poly24_32280 [Rosistilla carotiformis]|uniref:Spore protein YkvP/CgeB glycosyl transferase-like domain-containing protein n=1 Tax=Rosistilla carotiformis TaxID=2528017 RepID=A0A518JVD9_9BACT|nr:glycosyltransferase [Rosistilla carotiformis]QDV69512.1 hypothetical protein Poly24_32280 [Rosistilla carotiformis]